jgi:putative FmdB family regulatory protein
MPTYQYVCEKCGHQFDQFQPISAEPLTVCPEDLCTRKRWGKGKVRRAITAGAGLIFKGSGFYITDYRSEKYKEAAKRESSSASTTGGSSKAGSGGNGKPTTTKPADKPAKAVASES